MAYHYNNAQTSSDKAIEKFSEMMISRLEEAKATNWKKGWIGGDGNFGLPQNLNGRTYSGTNSLFLFMDTAINHYAAPVYMTFLQKEKEGLRLKKGSEAMPVIYWDMSIKDANGKKVSMSDYKNMTKEEREQCEVRPFLRSFRVYNIDQTNMQEVNKEKYDQIVARFQNPKIADTEGMYQNKALDRMFERQEWLCRIQYDKPSDRAYFSPSNDMIVLPQKGQFKTGKSEADIYKDGMEYYSTALHEMAHSTGTAERLNRTMGNRFGDSKYGKEELVAELSAAMVGNTMGFDRRIQDNNIAYVDNWLKALHEEPKFIVSVMADVNKASNLIIQKIDEQHMFLNQTVLKESNLKKLDNDLANTKSMEQSKITTLKHREIPVWETYENERSKDGDFTYYTTAEAFGQTLLAGIKDLLPRIKGTITLDQWGEEILTAEIKGDNRVFQTRYIPEALSAWIDIVPKEEEHSTMQSIITGKNIDIVAAYIYSSILSQKENQYIDLNYTNGEQNWESFDEIKKASREGKVSHDEYAAFWALTSSMGVPKEYLSKTAIAFLNHHIKDSENYGIDYLKGSKEAIGLLETGKVSAKYISINQELSESKTTKKKPQFFQGEQKRRVDSAIEKNKAGAVQIVRANIYKQPTGEYVVQASVNGQELEQKPIDNKTAVSYLQLNNSYRKEAMLSSIVKEKYGEELRQPKADNQVLTGIKL